jgi:DNA-binding Lrp family transcriptional regulator
LTDAQLSAVRAYLGSVPSGAPLPGVQMKLLAALDRAPRGVVSVRALAGRAGVSPTAAAKHLAELKARGLVREETRWVAEGRARERTILSLNDGAADWQVLAPSVRSVKLPARKSPQRRAQRVPQRLDHLFWNVASSQKKVATAGPIIARRLIETTDLDGLAWGLDALSPADWEHAARTRGISAAQRAMAENFAAAAEAGDA